MSLPLQNEKPNVKLNEKPNVNTKKSVETVGCHKFAKYACSCLLLAFGIIIGYFLLIGSGIFFTWIVTMNDYNIHTGCHYNDTIISEYNYDTVCYNNETNTQYKNLFCCLKDDKSIWGKCLYVGSLSLFCIAFVICAGIGIIYIFNKSCKKSNSEQINNDESNTEQINMDIIDGDKNEFTVISLEDDCENMSTKQINNSSTKQINNIPTNKYDDTAGLDGGSTSFDRLSE